MHTLKNIAKFILRLLLPYRLPLLLHTTGRRFPTHVPMTPAQAEALLSALHPDTGQSCLCRNTIRPLADLHVIIPVYNTAPYLRACLDSVYKQATRFSLFVSIIDDGSTDGSTAMLDDYHRSLEGTPMHARTEIVHQPNSGQARARNLALENIRGRYVTFVDSDDTLLPGAIDALMSAALEQDADIAEGNTDTGTPTYGMACGKVYRAELLRTVHFPPGYWFEDTINVFFLYPLCRKLIHVPGRHYHYRPNPASTMHSYQGDPRAIDSLWVSRRVLADYFASGHHATPQLFADFLHDALSTAEAIRTLHNDGAMQAAFVLLHHMAHTHFAPMLQDRATHATLPYTLRHAAAALAREDYRLFRAAQASACRF